ncbi:hypothetical protein M9H77_27709 [Catharanthus roseus]|uniref:Uncharacterized protein n=1 Tax=Catharanthus roseus TaxID=4058 RepID=A0ACC0ADU8_CATRO|nr:hypothetical protein M9H77_27709 [Catharanthus roseus]
MVHHSYQQPYLFVTEGSSIPNHQQQGAGRGSSLISSTLSLLPATQITGGQLVVPPMLTYQQMQEKHEKELRQKLKKFWENQNKESEKNKTKKESKKHSLPLARIKKIMKADEDVKMISAEAPVVLAKACEMFILELTLRSWYNTEENKRRTLQRADITGAIAKTEIFDFLVDVIPKDEVKNEPLFTLPRNIFSPTADHSMVRGGVGFGGFNNYHNHLSAAATVGTQHLGFPRISATPGANYMMNNRNVVDPDMHKRHIPYLALTLVPAPPTPTQVLWYHQAQHAEEEEQHVSPPAQALWYHQAQHAEEEVQQVPPAPPAQALWYDLAQQVEEEKQVPPPPPQSSSDS